MNRVSDCQRKITLLESKSVILKDRLGAYEREVGLRAQLEENESS